jgi:hypothetical protein
LRENLEYLTIYRPYYLPTLLDWAKDEKGNEQRAREIKDWDIALNDYAKKGYTVINSGTIPTENHVTFWAILEKA